MIRGLSACTDLIKKHSRADSMIPLDLNNLENRTQIHRHPVEEWQVHTNHPWERSLNERIVVNLQGVR
jgi:hypothetical protein